MRRRQMIRVLPRSPHPAAPSAAPVDGPRQLRRTVIDFSSQPLPPDVRLALADAFWNHFGGRPDNQLLTLWANVRVFVRFAVESAFIHSLADIDRAMLVRYVEWLNGQHRSNGQPWTKSSRASAYTTLRTLLRWLARSRAGVLGEIQFPFNPFPWRNRDSERVQKLSARELRAILKACERDIQGLRNLRDQAERARASNGNDDPSISLGALLEAVDQRYGGIVQTHAALGRAGEVLVSGTVAGTVVGGPFKVTDRGLHELRGVPGRWPLQ